MRDTHTGLKRFAEIFTVTQTAGTGLRRRIRKLAKQLCPPTLVDEAKRFQACDKNERGSYLKLRIVERGAIPSSRDAIIPAGARTFLFVCHGNIIRSPMCEALMKRELLDGKSNLRVASAGIHAVPGNQAHPWAIRAAHELGISLADHRARLLSEQDVVEADVVFAMDYQNQVQLFMRWPQARSKIFMLGGYAALGGESVEIHDPFYRGEMATAQCYRQLSKCIHNLVGSMNTVSP